MCLGKLAMVAARVDSCLPLVFEVVQVTKKGCIDPSLVFSHSGEYRYPCKALMDAIQARENVLACVQILTSLEVAVQRRNWVEEVKRM